MNKEPYLYKREVSKRYRFLSTGRRPVEKIAEFTPLAIKNTYNPGFGDYCPMERLMIRANSNSGDIIQVLSTIINIVKDFTVENPESKIAF